MQIGSIVTVTAYIEPARDEQRRKVRRIECAPRTCVYLGKSMLREGRIHRGGETWDTYDDPWLAVEKSIAVAVVQPLNGHGRYRLPFRALPEDVQLHSVELL